MPHNSGFDIFSTSRPFSKISPPTYLAGGVGTSRAMDNAVTLLPQPLSPTRQTVSPASMLNEISSTARTATLPEPNSSLRFLISSKDIFWRTTAALTRLLSQRKETGKPEQEASWKTRSKIRQGPSPFLSHRRAKHQAPKPKLQRSSKSQNTKPQKQMPAQTAPVGF